MSELYTHMEELASQAKKYFKTRLDVVKLNAADKVSSVTSNLVTRMFVAVVFFFFLLFAGVAAGLALGEWLGKSYWGFSIVAGFYLLAGIIVWIAREKLIRIPIMNAIIQQLFRNEEDQKY